MSGMFSGLGSTQGNALSGEPAIMEKLCCLAAWCKYAAAKPISADPRYSPLRLHPEDSKVLLKDLSSFKTFHGGRRATYGKA